MIRSSAQTRQTFPENNNSHVILFESHCSRQVILSTPERVQSRCRSISRIVVPYPAYIASRHTNDDVCAIHWIEIMTRCVWIEIV